ncbi:putative phosphatase YcdX [Agarivorans gilvus]|uniref:Phosphatase YcdX n=2 Tax=Agarivorans gilvus TaxID=680279 RepID=A0ABQ1I525_9ALTE|nr:putative phosphatase YcdX [Agarivorans gilvus]
MKIKPEVDLHLHTIASTHAYSTLHDYVHYAKQNGIKMFAVSDHGPDMTDAPHEWHFINSALFPRVDQGIGILRGIEANIKSPAGEIDCNQRMRAQLDIILCGFHQEVFPPQSIHINTEAMLNTIKSGLVNVITHPGNPAFPIDAETIVKAAAQYNVALEINNSSFIHSRKGSEANCERIVQLAKLHDAPLSIGSDAHIAYDIGRFDKALALLEANDFPPERIINCSMLSLLDHLADKGKALHQEFSELLS